MKTLIKIVHLINGYELHYRVYGTNKIVVDFVERPSMRLGGK